VVSPSSGCDPDSPRPYEMRIQKKSSSAFFPVFVFSKPFGSASCYGLQVEHSTSSLLYCSSQRFLRTPPLDVDPPRKSSRWSPCFDLAFSPIGSVSKVSHCPLRCRLPFRTQLAPRHRNLPLSDAVCLDTLVRAGSSSEYLPPQLASLPLPPIPSLMLVLCNRGCETPIASAL